MTDEQAKQIEALYENAITRLEELLAEEKRLIAEYRKSIEEHKIRELQAQIQKNG